MAEQIICLSAERMRRMCADRIAGRHREADREWAVWADAVLECCNEMLSHTQQFLDAHDRLAYERVMGEIQPPALHPKPTQQLAEPVGGATLSEVIDKAKEHL